MIHMPTAALRSVARNLLQGMGLEISRIPRAAKAPGYECVMPKADFAPWNNDRSFKETYRTIASHTLVDKYRCYELWTLIEQCKKLSGAIIEVGVWRGGTGGLIAHQAKRCGIRDIVYLCDTFSGVVKAGQQDSMYRGGEHADASREIVKDLVTRRLKLDNVVILQGTFPDETAHLVESQLFRFCHIDVDVHDSAKEILNWIWPKLAIGGIVVYDDYGFGACSGITQHVDQQRHDADRLVIHNLNGHALVVKIG